MNIDLESTTAFLLKSYPEYSSTDALREALRELNNGNLEIAMCWTRMAAILCEQAPPTPVAPPGRSRRSHDHTPFSAATPSDG